MDVILSGSKAIANAIALRSRRIPTGCAHQALRTLLGAEGDEAHAIIPVIECRTPREASPLQSTVARSMRHLMPILTPRLILRPPTLGDLDSIQCRKRGSVARFAALDDLGLRGPTVAASDGTFDSARNGLPESSRNPIGRISPNQRGFRRPNRIGCNDEPDVYETGYWVAPNYAGQGMATEATNAVIRYAFGHLGARAISIGYFDGNEPSRRIVEKLGFQKLRIAPNAATRCLDGAKLDRHEYILTSPHALPALDVSWG